MLRVCWRRAQKKGWVVESVHHALPVLVLQEQKQLHHLARLPTLCTTNSAIFSIIYLRHGGGTGFHHGLVPVTRPLRHRSHRTPLHCSYPTVPRSPLSWPPDAQTTLFIYIQRTNSYPTHLHTLSTRNYGDSQPHSTCVITAQHKLHNSQSLTCKHSINLIDTYKIHCSRSCEFDFGTLRDKTDVAYIKNKKLTIRKR